MIFLFKKWFFRIFKWLAIGCISIFILLSIIPYLFSIHKKNPNDKPFDNSYNYIKDQTRFHFRVYRNYNHPIQSKVCFIHGFSGSSFSFRKNIDTLLQENTLVVCIDLPGFGFSEKSPSGNYTDTIRNQALHEILSLVSKSTNTSTLKWNLVGHSMGATVAYEVAALYPYQTKSLTLIDGYYMYTSRSFYQNLLSYPPLLRWADIVSEKKFCNESSFKELLESAYNKTASPDDIQGYLTPFKEANSGSAIFRMSAATGFQKEVQIPKTIPVLIIWGKDDHWIPYQNAYSQLKEKNIHLIKNAGHCPMETNPDEFNRLFANFIFNE